MIEEYKGLAVAFGLLFLILTAYFVKWMLAAPKPAPPPVQSVYVDVVPQDRPAAR